ncbi:MAG: pitrilysin family protein [Blastocatellia bacterium]
MHFKPSIVTSFIPILITTLLLGTTSLALRQSGRGRPKVPQPTTTNSQPLPVISVPSAASVIKQEQVGTTSRFVLRNGITVVINEQHAVPIAASVAYFKTSSFDEPQSLPGAPRLLQHLLLKGSKARSRDGAIASLRALGATIEARTSIDGAAYSVVAPSDKLKSALAIQADIVQNPSFDEEAVQREIHLVIEEEKRAAFLDDGLTSFTSDAFTGRHITVRGDQAAVGSVKFGEPAAYSMARLFNLTFTGSPSADLELLRSITRDKLFDLYRTRYRPANLIISVAGDISTFNTLVEIQQLFAPLGAVPGAADERGAPSTQALKTRSAVTQSSSPAGPAPSSQNALPTIRPQSSELDKASAGKSGLTLAQEKLRYAADRADISQSIVGVGFHLPGAESRDWPAIEVLTAVLGQGRSSRLSRALIDGQMAANRVESNYRSHQRAGFLTIQVWSSDSREGFSIDRVESALFKELDRLRREVPTDGEMARAKTMLEKRFLDATGAYVDRASAFAHAEAIGIGFRSVLDYRTRIRAVAGEDVQRAAASYLTLANTSVYELEPLSAAPRTFDATSFEATVKAWAPGFAQPVESTAVRVADANYSIAAIPQGTERPSDRQYLVESLQPLPIRDFSTLNGPRAFVREEHSQQSVTVAILFQGGRLVEESTNSGQTELMVRSILYGTPRRTFSQLTQELEQLGADVQIIVEPDFFGFMLSVLSRNSDRALKLLRDVIEEPAFRDDDVARARVGQIAAIRDARDSGLARSRELLFGTLFPGHAYSLPPHGREEIVMALTGAKLGEWHSRLIKRQLPFAIIVGDTDGSALVSSQIAEGFRRRDVDTAIQVRTPQTVPQAEKAERRLREQTALAAGFLGPKADSPDLIAIQLIESAFDGEGGRLLQELRDKQDVVFDASLFDEPLFLAGMISAVVSTSPENEERARAALVAEFERVLRAGLTPEELSSSRAVATTRGLSLFQSQSQHALAYARAVFSRQPASDVDSFSEKAAKLSTEDIKRVWATYFKSTASAGVVRGTPQAKPQSSSKQD